MVWNRGARYQCVPERRGQDPSYLLHLRARPRHAERRLPLHGPGPKGTRRGRRRAGHVASAPRRIPGLMTLARMLSTLGLIRTSRRSGFCPACRLFQTGDAPQEIAAPALIALVFLIVAGLAWASTIARSRSMDGMAMGLGSFGPFVAGWAVMMTAMMIPSATPLVFD